MMDEKTKGILVRCARTYFSLKNWAKARQEYEGIVADYPNDPFVLEPLALVHQNLGDQAKAQDYARRAIEAFKVMGHQERAAKVAEHFGLSGGAPTA